MNEIGARISPAKLKLLKTAIKVFIMVRVE